jgi:hypothetical protein
MVLYVEKDASQIWDELKSKIPKLKTGVFEGKDLIEFEADLLNNDELALLKVLTGKDFVVKVR